MAYLQGISPGDEYPCSRQFRYPGSKSVVIYVAVGEEDVFDSGNIELCLQGGKRIVSGWAAIKENCLVVNFRGITMDFSDYVGRINRVLLHGRQQSTAGSNVLGQGVLHRALQG